MPDREAVIARFPRRIRDRLDAFSEAVDTLPADAIRLYATRPLDAVAHDTARDTADRIAGEHGWGDGVAALRGLALDWVDGRLRDPQAALAWTGARNEAFSTRTGDLALAAQSLTDAFRAVAFWDELDEADRDELLGPWASLVETV
jgi:hypothetical protein